MNTKAYTIEQLKKLQTEVSQAIEILGKSEQRAVDLQWELEGMFFDEGDREAEELAGEIELVGNALRDRQGALHDWSKEVSAFIGRI